jgi:hypothetical protein
MAVSVPTNPNALLRRTPLAEALTELGYPVAPATLATMATRGGGPPFQLFGRIPLYRWGDALAWAQSRLSAPRGSTSEASRRGFNASHRPCGAGPPATPNRNRSCEAVQGRRRLSRRHSIKCNMDLIR